MAKQDINLGAFPDDDSPGVDVVRSAFQKAKENFTELYARPQGDMLKSAYDSDNTGVVDSAEKVEGVDLHTTKKYYGTDASGVPGFFDLVIEATNIVFYTDAKPKPLEGIQNVVYIDKTNKKIEVWDGTAYSVVAGGTVTAQAITDALTYTPANDSEVVKTVTGAGVDNTDPQNPVINIPESGVSDVQDSNGNSLVENGVAVIPEAVTGVNKSDGTALPKVNGVVTLPPIEAGETYDDTALSNRVTSLEGITLLTEVITATVAGANQVFTLPNNYSQIDDVKGRFGLLRSEYTALLPNQIKIIPELAIGDVIEVQYWVNGVLNTPVLDPLYSMINSQKNIIDRLTDKEEPLFFNTAALIKSNTTPGTIEEVPIISRDSDYTFSVDPSYLGSYSETLPYSIVVKDSEGKHSVYVIKKTNKTTGVITTTNLLPLNINSYSPTHDNPTGIHLSNYGYNALAEGICDMIERYSYKKNTIFTYNPLISTGKSGGGLAAYSLLDTNILVANFQGVNSPSTGGNVPGTRNLPNVVGSARADTNVEYYNLYRRSYVITQGGTENKGVFLDIDLSGRTTGFLKTFVGIQNRSYNSSDLEDTTTYYTGGACVISCKDTHGNEFFSQTVRGATEEINIPFNNEEKITIQYVTETSEPTSFFVSFIEVHEKRDALNSNPIKDDSVISFLGDSWTQFPVAKSGETEPLRPDGDTLAEGMQRLSERFKEYSLEKGNKITTINQGRGGMTSEWGRFWVDRQIVQWKTESDYCIIFFSINDFNSRDTYETTSVYDFSSEHPYNGTSNDVLGSVNLERWIQNIKYISDRLLKAGIKPIICTPPITASAPFSNPLTGWANSLIESWNKNEIN